jgi:hypothetical protein
VTVTAQRFSGDGGSALNPWPTTTRVVTHSACGLSEKLEWDAPLFPLRLGQQPTARQTQH